MMAALNAKKNVLPNVMWIMDRLFKYTNFGIVSKIHQDFFITSVSYPAVKGHFIKITNFLKLFYRVKIIVISP